MNNLLVNNGQPLSIILVVALVTIAIRFLPFVIFGRGSHIPAFITYLSGVLQYAIIGMLVVYCLKDINPASANHGLPEFIAVAAVVGLHLWKKNTLFSIAAGTVFYMILVQFVF